MTIATEHPPTPQPLPIPPDFPVHWEQSGDEQRFWTWDRMHFPEALMPLDTAISILLHNVCFNDAATAYGLPLRIRAFAPNGYMYSSAAPITLDPAALRTIEEHLQQRMPEIVGALRQRWEGEYLPELQEHLAAWERFDLQAATQPDLLAHLEDTIERMIRCGGIHFRIVLPMVLAMSQFDELYRDLFGDDEAFAPFKLLQGFPNKSVEAGHALWQLSRRALAVPEVRRVLETASADAVPAELARSAVGRAFLVDLRDYLAEYGQRGDKFTIGAPSWIEDPRPAIKMLKDYCGQMEGDPEAERAALAAEREQHIARARARLAGYPQPVVEQFVGILAAAQAATILQEDHAFWIDQRMFYRVREVLREFGRRFAASDALAATNDVFFLTLDELRATARATPFRDWRPLARERQAALAHQQTLSPPPALGMAPPGPPPDDPMSRAVGKFWGAPPPPPEPGLLRGSPGSPGRVRGPAKVVRALGDAGKLQRGDILVAETTAPPWTPLFATAAAVVTDTGGVLSHCAIVAREYGIPAVVGTGGATTTLRDGQLVEVDGDNGVVSILDE